MAVQAQFRTAPLPAVEESPIVPMFLSALFPGFGHMISGRFGRAVKVLLIFFGYFIIVLGMGYGISSVILYPGLFLIWLWNIYDVYRCIRDANQEARYQNTESYLSLMESAPRVNPRFAKPVAAPEVQPEPAVVQIPVSPVESTASGFRFCPSCGSPIERSTGKFCRNCGKSLQ